MRKWRRGRGGKKEKKRKSKPTLLKVWKGGGRRGGGRVAAEGEGGNRRRLRPHFTVKPFKHFFFFCFVYSPFDLIAEIRHFSCEENHLVSTETLRRFALFIKFVLHFFSFPSPPPPPVISFPLWWIFLFFFSCLTSFDYNSTQKILREWICHVTRQKTEGESYWSKLFPLFLSEIFFFFFFWTLIQFPLD